MDSGKWKLFVVSYYHHLSLFVVLTLDDRDNLCKTLIKRSEFLCTHLSLLFL